MQGRYAYVLSSANNQLLIVDVISCITSIVDTVTAAALNGDSQVYVQGRYAYIANTGTLHSK